MKVISIQTIKKELTTRPPAEVLELCVRLAKFKKDNKELLGYLLFEAHDLQTYIDEVKQDTSRLFSELHPTNLFLVKKSLRKILRLLNKYTRYTGSKQAEIALRIHFCKSLRTSGVHWQKSAAISKIYTQQLNNIYELLDSLHEDLKYDYLKEVQAL